MGWCQGFESLRVCSDSSCQKPHCNSLRDLARSRITGNPEAIDHQLSKPLRRGPRLSQRTTNSDGCGVRGSCRNEITFGCGGPQGFERRYMLAGNAGEHQPEAIRTILLKLLPGKTEDHLDPK